MRRRGRTALRALESGYPVEVLTQAHSHEHAISRFAMSVSWSSVAYLAKHENDREDAVDTRVRYCLISAEAGDGDTDRERVEIQVHWGSAHVSKET